MNKNPNIKYNYELKLYFTRGLIGDLDAEKHL